MSFPGVIERPLLTDEFSIYLDNTVPIPLSALATFLGKIDKAAQSVRAMEGRFLVLSDFALGSNELRFKVVGEGRQAREKADREERMVAATEKSAKAAIVSAGAAVVGSVVAVVALSIASGNANPSASKIVHEYNVSNIYVRSPDDAPHIITREDVERGWRSRRADKWKGRTQRLELENEVLMGAMHRHETVNLAGRLFRDRSGQFYFETMIGNKFPVRFPQAGSFAHTPVAIEAIIQDSFDGPQLDVVQVIAELSDY